MIPIIIILTGEFIKGISSCFHMLSLPCYFSILIKAEKMYLYNMNVALAPELILLAMELLTNIYTCTLLMYIWH